ncbi:MAG: hemerythrin family protein [Deltaproteobacteria bacterium]|nr:hemerythrin family protein [Deltaproteobacteria bacterium]
MFEWTPELAVGVEVIDAQHRELFSTVNTLLEAIKEGQEREEVVMLMDFLEEYVANHFGIEEIYMRRYTYFGYPAHKAEHIAFVNDFYDMREEMERVGVTADLTGNLKRRVCDWLVNHVCDVDKGLGAYLKEYQENIRKNRETSRK